MKYLSSFYKGPAYATRLREKMKKVEDAAQAMDDHAGLNQHMRLQDIRQVTWDSMNGVPSDAASELIESS